MYIVSSLTHYIIPHMLYHFTHAISYEYSIGPQAPLAQILLGVLFLPPPPPIIITIAPIIITITIFGI